MTPRLPDQLQIEIMGFIEVNTSNLYSFTQIPLYEILFNSKKVVYHWAFNNKQTYAQKIPTSSN